MLFSQLSSYFEKLEATSSRLALIDILADLFKHSSEAEIEKIIYLSQGRIAPFFEATEIGMAEKQVAQAIASAFNSTKQDVLKLYGEVGDMGEAAMQIVRGPVKSNPSRQGSLFASLKVHAVGSPSSFATPRKKITVSDVFEILTQIAKTQGLGTVEKRQVLLSDLLRKSDSNSVRYLVRIPLGNLRLGIGDPTILDGLAKAKLGDKSKRKLLEGAYNRTSDLGLIAKTLWEKGLAAVIKLQVVVGKPIRSELCERLPNAEKAIEKMEIVSVQPKYDGFRVQIHKDGDKVSMFSRNLENMTHMFPELIEGTLKQIKTKTAILDTEALAYQPESEEFLPFQETTKRRRKYGIEEMTKTLPLKAFVFDILYKDGKSLIDKPLSERLVILKQTLIINGTLIPAKTQTVRDAKTLNIILEDSISKGLEGVVIKKLESPYEAGGRNFNWVKLKRQQSGELNDTLDCVILGYVFGKGKRTAFGAGALLVGVYDDKNDEFVTVSKIGTGLSDEEWKEIHKRADKIKVDHKPARVNSVIEPSVWIKPEIVIEILADEITRSPIHTAGAVINQSGEKEPGYALRFPRLVSFRTSDKKPEDATTVKELIEMYKLQNKK
ncbi:MAG: DNA ligase [Candidatus Levybacteria bacterium RIFCSPLOWO2_12_FULL_37_14]|nr:MAG: putative DNA ligase [Candidatus Levybacteria bacterium GW2011_GWB1_37_8]OGH51637.1 MAG: DNA ligase [Candidatus Levybacteria bacterium RIFCSPLOWO2_12_FULL_37_14]